MTDTLRIPIAQLSDQSCKPGGTARGREMERELWREEKEIHVDKETKRQVFAEKVEIQQ